MMISAAVQQVMNETGMGELQAYRHLQQRALLKKRGAGERRDATRRGLSELLG